MTAQQTSASNFTIVFQERDRIVAEDALHNKTDDDALDELRRFSEHVAAEPVVFFTRC
jgi:hypothetical protein